MRVAAIVLVTLMLAGATLASPGGKGGKGGKGGCNNDYGRVKHVYVPIHVPVHHHKTVVIKGHGGGHGGGYGGGHGGGYGGGHGGGYGGGYDGGYGH